MNENLEKNVAPQENSEAQAISLITFEKPKLDAPSYDKTVEEARDELYKAYRKSRKISNIITIVVLIAGLGGMLCITQNDPNLAFLPIIGWVIIGLTVAGLFAFYLFNRNKFPNRTREYIKVITKALNEANFADEKFTEVTSNLEEKLNIEEIIGDSAYENVASVSSRNVIHGKYCGNDFLMAECALNRPSQNKKEGPLFVGRYLTLPNSLEMKGRIIISIKNHQTPLDLPNKVNDLTCLKDEQALSIYGLKETDVEKVLGKKFYNEFLSKFALKDHLVNVNLVVWSGKSSLYLSYDDAAMTLPFDKPLVKEAVDQMIENLNDACALLMKIGK